MKIEDLRRILSGGGKLGSDISDTQWQEYFNFMKLTITQSRDRNIRHSCGSVIIGGCTDDKQFAYRGETQWGAYRNFINDVLKTIRAGKCDYCYYTYQIADLLKYEHDKLITQWLPEYGCFQVWLRS